MLRIILHKIQCNDTVTSPSLCSPCCRCMWRDGILMMQKVQKEWLAADQERFLHSPWMDGACSFCGGYEWYEVCHCKACGLQCMWRLYTCSMLWQLSIICDIFWQHLITYDLSKHFLKIVDKFSMFRMRSLILTGSAPKCYKLQWPLQSLSSPQHYHHVLRVLVSWDAPY